MLNVISSCPLPNRLGNITFFYMLVLITYLHIELYCPTIFVTVHSKDLLSGMVVSLEFSMLIITPSSVMIDNSKYTLAHIYQQLIHTSLFLIKFTMLIINSIMNLSYSLRVGSIGGILVIIIINCFQNLFYMLSIYILVDSLPQLPNFNDIVLPT